MKSLFAKIKLCGPRHEKQLSELEVERKTRPYNPTHWPCLMDWVHVIPYEQNRGGDDPYRGYDNPIPSPGTCMLCGAPQGEECNDLLHFLTEMLEALDKPSA